MNRLDRINVLMQVTTGLLLCLLIFTIRATISFWMAGGIARATCLSSTFACIVAIVTNDVAERKLRSTEA